MRQIVDPFSPVRPVSLRAKQPVRHRVIQRSKFNHTSPVVRDIPEQNVSSHNPFLPTKNFRQATKTIEPANTGNRAMARANAILHIPVFIVFALAFSYLLQSLFTGSIAVGVYAIFVFVRRVPSKVSFQLSIIALLGIVALLGLGTDAQLVSNYAIYTLLLIIIGTVSLTWE